ncbi:phosphoribosylanthranilate isomerase [Pontibacter sp. SGAir0037]|uniref:phosphoribosylanthranilate isomerase n=1 Tax=Pontibacter sp. SGAir0037 TaxID=2571030 RepID=UPI0010CD141E|nr:phosphoribosylanthranilate isomerase [Pontibacter sp. SGAir0037]QCR22001.1 N-(5'-phosphoribosyl)anthranilate isomerase [Pontibacter sp. SGAir0037]
MKIKVCGMREPENIQQVAALQPDYLGFIFFSGSRRYALPGIDASSLANLPAGVQRVGVFVNETTTVILDLARQYNLELVQLHGSETPAQCLELQQTGLKVIKVFSVGESFNFDVLAPFENTCDFFLFDTKGKEHGGNGFVFDWEQLNQYPSPKPYFLSGGLNLENISGIKSIRRKPFAIDVNSGFELQPGLKEVEKLKRLMEQVKS